MSTPTNEYREIIGYGLHDGQLIHISQVERGLDCGCVCPACGATLMAKKGDIKSHHFAHYNATDCGHANESILHKLGKEIIATHKKVQTPKSDLTIIKQDLTGQSHTFEHPVPAHTLLFAEIHLEQDQGGFRPDITAVTPADEPVYIEIVVSHALEEWTLEKVKQQPFPMLSIDLSALDPLADHTTLTEAVLFSAPRAWLHHEELDLWIRDKEIAAELAIDEINNGIRDKVQQFFGPEEDGEHHPLPTPGFGEVVALGYSSASGYSQKSQRAFDVSILKVISPLNQNGSPNYRIRGQGGYEIEDINFDPSIIPKLEALQYPCTIRPKFENLYIAGRMRPTVVDLIDA